MTDWRDLRPAAFDTDAKPQPLTLFPEPDPTGTPDLFSEVDERTETES